MEPRAPARGNGYWSSPVPFSLDWLQWSHARLRVETDTGIIASYRVCGASMEPRAPARGNMGRGSRFEGAAWCFNGATRACAWKPASGSVQGLCSLLLQWSHARLRVETLG